jgi:glycolate oxidase
VISPLELLRKELGKVSVDERYWVDESGLAACRVEGAVLPESADEIAIVLRLAKEHGFAVTPRGAGTGMTGGCLAARGGVVLSTERMTVVREIDGEDLVAVVEPGVITGDLQAAVEAQGLFFPPDPASLASCTLGGNVAENAGGPRAFKYGVTREYVLGLGCVLMGGERMRMGRRTQKGVVGYDLTALMVGSEGTLAVVDEIVVKLLPKPAATATLLSVFADVSVAADAVTKLIGIGSRPRALELLDRATIEHLRGRTPYRIPDGAGAILIVELDGDAEGLDAGLLRCANAIEAAGAREILVAQSEQQRRDLWETRRRANPSLKEQHRHKIAEDVVVPRSKMATLIRRVDAIAGAHDVVIATYGHAGDGNLHINLLVDESPIPPRVDAAIADIMRATLELGGTLAGEHGVGLLKMKYVPWEQTPPLLRIQRQLKRMFDPHDLLNPGKMFPDA